MLITVLTRAKKQITRPDETRTNTLRGSLTTQSREKEREPRMTVLAKASSKFIGPTKDINPDDVKYNF
jgi:hypothetical protein